MQHEMGMQMTEAVMAAGNYPADRLDLFAAAAMQALLPRGWASGVHVPVLHLLRWWTLPTPLQLAWWRRGEL